MSGVARAIADAEDAEQRVARRPLTRAEQLRGALDPRVHGPRIALFALVIVMWQLIGEASSPYTFAPPSAVIRAGAQMLSNGTLERALWSSLGALAIGYGLAVAIGVPLGFATGTWRSLGRTFDPLIAALYVVPVAAITPVIVAVAGPGLEASVVVIFLFAFFEPLLSAQAGAANVDPSLIDVARTFGARRLEIVRRVMLPASLPYVFVGLRLAAARAITGMVIGEMLFSASGLGGLIINSATDFRIDRVLAAVVTVSLLGVLLTALIRGLERQALRWSAPGELR